MRRERKLQKEPLLNPLETSERTEDRKKRKARMPHLLGKACIPLFGKKELGPEEKKERA